MTEPTELYITKADIPEMYNAVDNTLTLPFVTLFRELKDSTELKKSLRRSLLAMVDSIERDSEVGISPTTAQCRKFAKGKL